MEKLFRNVKGCVQIAVTGEQCERFLNLCRARGLVMWNLQRTGEDEVRCVLSLDSFRSLRPMRSKTGVHIKILRKSGLPFFFYRNKKRKAFFLGAMICGTILFLCSLRIWNIHIDGNQTYSTPEILSFLEEAGVVHGMPKSQVECAKIASMVRAEYPKITWVSAKIDGTKLIVTVQEGKRLNDQPQTEGNPCSLVSGLDGRIVKMVTRRGIPMVQEGDVCREGDLLIRGYFDITNDSQEAVRREYVEADGDIYVAHGVAYYHAFPMTYQKTEGTGEIKKRWYLKLGHWYLGNPPDKKEGYQCITEEFPARLTENFCLPVSLGVRTIERLQTTEQVYTEEEARSLAKANLERFEEELIEKGMEITENNVVIETDHTQCVARGTIQVVEKTGIPVPVESMSSNPAE